MPDVVHPIVVTHPYSKRKSLFVNEGFTVSVVDMDAAESADLLATLYAHSRQPQFVYRHKWQVGDLVMWDNLIGRIPPVPVGTPPRNAD